METKRDETKQITLWITCEQLVKYSQQIQVSEEEFQLLKEFEGIDVMNTRKPSRERDCYNVLLDKLDHSEINDAEEEYKNIMFEEE